MQRLLVLVTLFQLLLGSGAAEQRSSSKPNIVVFLVDDLGIADLGCFGNATIKTPNIDRLASLGAKLNHNLAPESICTPSRAATLTGRYAIRSGLASGPGALRAFSNLASPGGLPTSEITIGKMLQNIGYKTSFIGKWHLGLNCKSRTDACHHPINMGFNQFYGLPLSNLRDCGPTEEGSVLRRLLTKFYLHVLAASLILALTLVYTGIASKTSASFCACLTVLSFLAVIYVSPTVMTSMICVLMRDFEVVEQPTRLENLTVKFTNEAKHFIQINREKPFLLFMSYAKVHAVLFTSAKFKGHSTHGRYGDNVEEMDWSVGEIVSVLQEENMLENTFVYFTSDNGPFLEIILGSGEHLGGWNGPYRGGKAQSWEGGIRVPTIAVWEGMIRAGIVIDEPTNTMDLLPTVAAITGANCPRDRIIDGKNILPLLKEDEVMSPHDFMFHYCGSSLHAVRYRPRTGGVTWKAHFITPKWSPGHQHCAHALVVCECFDDDVNVHNPPLLYDITNDPYETTQLDAIKYKDILRKMTVAISKHQASIKQVPPQLGYPNSWWRPHLQPCCNFPFCSCVEGET